jgi:hypothetical protein
MVMLTLVKMNKLDLRQGYLLSQFNSSISSILGSLILFSYYHVIYGIAERLVRAL